MCNSYQQFNSVTITGTALADQKHPCRSQKQLKVSKSSEPITYSSLPGTSAPSIASVSVGTEDSQNNDDAMSISGKDWDSNQCCVCFDDYDKDEDTEWVQSVCKR